MASAREPSAVSLEVFVLQQLSLIAQETNGRSQGQKDVREAALKLLEELGVADFGKPGSRLSNPFPPDVTAQLLGVLRGALALQNPRLADPALSCMHKLVAYAYLQGETSTSGRMDDEANFVTQVVGLTSKCGESSSAGTQLQVVKALLTYVTAEHFLAHGDCLMQAVRTVFNIAIGADSPDIQNTARSALLQMVNTVLKRVGQQVMSPNGTPLPSPAGTLFRPWGSTSGAMSAAAAAAMAVVGADRRGSSSVPVMGPGAPSASASSSLQEEGRSYSASEAGLGSQALPSPADSGLLMALSQEMAVTSPLAASGPSADMAEAADMAAAAADMAELQATLPRIHTSPPTPTSLAAAPQAGVGVVLDAAAAAVAGAAGGPPLPPGGAAAASAEQFVAAAVEADARTAQLASMAEQSDLRGLERALDSLPQGGEPGSLPPVAGSRAALALARQDTPPDPRRSLMKDRRAAAWRMLTPAEKDALIVLTAMCKMAARETGFGAVEGYMHQGKLLALDLLVRVLTNPMHDWTHMRPEFAAELRHPLCLVLLRNCASPYDQAVTAAVRLFEAILSAQKLRAGLKAELGALYPLLLLKPVEAAAPESAHSVVMAAEGLLHVCSHPQVLVDLFVNYDCSLQAANLYERTVKAVRRLMQLAEPNPLFSAAVTQKLKATALKALLAAIQSLDTWAGPIKSAAAAVALAPDASTALQAGAAAGVGDGDGTPGTSPQPRDKEELQRILADKELKDALLSGIQLFNQNPVKGLRALAASGVIPGASPAAAARFLREHAARLDRTQVGELMGHHEEHSVEVMHAYIDAEQLGGLSLDEALRRLLAGFRLPGEAQKIDRIMEKFAERFCKDNPQAFKNADGAYLLAFAIIMLNTDAHNPMADRRISADDFVSMAMCQVEGGEAHEFEQILPTPQLLEIYKRITEREIAVHGEEEHPEGPAGAAAGMGSGGGKQRGGGAGDRKADSSRRAKLAAAVGVTQMVLPFWSGATWDKQHGVAVERRRLLEFTRQMMAAGGAVAGNIWHTATHAEHARPMMQVSGDAFLQCLQLALEAAPSMPQALQVLAGYEQAVRLAALLRLEAICEALVAGLAGAAGLGAPAQHSSAAEAKQASLVAALSKLVSLGSCSEAGMLGSSWLILLRALSQLERLQALLLPGSKDGLPPLPDGAAAIMAASSLDAAAAAAAAAASAPAAALPPPPQASSSFGRLLQRMGFSGSGSEAAPGGAHGAGGSGKTGLAAIKDAPGAGHVMWAETAGVAAVERLYSNSASLHGDAVVSFMRALCAVSQEELHPTGGQGGERPRVGLLQRVVECAYHNMGRIRLVWARLWTLVAQHLVSAACHTDAYVAMYAVDALRQLAAKLLDRAELARFTHQGEALRPFAAVLRHSDSPAVRELAVACVAHAVSAHPRGLGSGWRSVLEALTLAARDASPTVVGQALDALQPVVEALFRPAGHTLLRECVAAVLAGVENPHGLEDLSIGALYLFQALARRLDEATAAGSLDNGPALAAALEALQMPGSPTASPSKEEQPPLAAAGSLERAGSLQVQQQPAPAAVVAAAAAADAVAAAWQTLLVPLAAVARLDGRPRAADAAAAVLLQVFKQHGDSLSPQQWQRLYQIVLLPLLALPADPTAAGIAPGLAAAGSSSSGAVELVSRRCTTGGGGAAESLPTAVPAALSFEGLDRLERQASAHMPDLWQLILDPEFAAEGELEASSSGGSNGAAFGSMQLQPSASGSLQLQRSSSGLGGASTAVVAASSRRLPLLWQPALQLLQQYIRFPSESAAVLGVNQLHQLLLAAAPALDAASWQAALLMLQAVALRDPWQPDTPEAGPGSSSNGHTAAVGLPPGMTVPGSGGPSSQLAAAAAADAMRRRSRLAVLLQRVLDSLLQRHMGAMPGQVQLQLLDLLHRTVKAAAATNADAWRCAAAARTLAAAAGGKQLLGAWELVADGSLAAGAAAGGLDGPDGVDDPPAAATGDAAAAQWEQLHPALARQEAEGGCLYIGALQRCMASPASSNGTQAAVAAECEARLADFCLWVVQGAAGRVHGSAASSANGSSGGFDGGSGSLAAGGSMGAAGAGGAPSAADQPWDDAVRSPLVDAALQAYAALSPSAWGRQQAAAFPHLATLVCSPSHPVRKALKALLQRQVPTVLEGAMAAAAR